MKKEKFKLKTVNTASGITLVALVVTIVVLLILAGITIVYVFGDNGIFKLTQDAKDKTEQAKKDEQEYFNNVANMINEYTNGIRNEGETVNPPTPTEPEEMPIESIKSDWETIEKIAKEIANDDTITSGSNEATEIVDGKKYTIKVGDIFEVKYNEEVKRVRVLGFKHDDLVEQIVYGGNHSKAGISFEFYDFMTGSTYMKMNTSDKNEGGWASTKIRTDLNGTGSTIGGLGANLSNKSYIKQVKKIYNPTYGGSSPSSTSDDYLWLLSCSEIWTSGVVSGANYGYGKVKEGEQYQYYKGVVTGTGSNDNLVKKVSDSGSSYDWGIRTPAYFNSDYFCCVDSDGSANRNFASYPSGVAPGFSI